ncbi:helix-turn-helix domain-containing protein [Rhodococcus sp. NPDC059968]|uniref:helix-turn-helix domain-containing protein n=1 Tax=Rhodococcus sp. NPDC059968 TaxID=3347017 RepID=UPI00366E9C2E
MRDISAHDNPSATGTFVDDGPGNPFKTSHLPWNLEFDPAVAPTTTRVDLGEPWVVGCRVGRMSGRRRAPEIRDTPGEYVALLMVHHGTEILAQQGRSTEVPAGTAALWDGVRPVECFSAASLVKSTMFVPRALLAGAVPDLESVFVRTIEDSATLRLLTGWLDVSMRQTILDRDTAHTAGRMAVDLLHSALARTRGDVSDSREVLLLQIKDFLDRNLGDPDLTLDMVARANAVSVRYLHMLFQGTGETAREFLRRRRLERAQRLLLGSGPELPVAEVAIRSGFDSPSSFSRAYRTRFGVAPREARRQSTAA